MSNKRQHSTVHAGRCLEMLHGSILDPFPKGGSSRSMMFNGPSQINQLEQFKIMLGRGVGVTILAACYVRLTAEERVEADKFVASFVDTTPQCTEESIAMVKRWAEKWSNAPQPDVSAWLVKIRDIADPAVAFTIDSLSMTEGEDGKAHITAHTTPFKREFDAAEQLVADQMGDAFAMKPLSVAVNKTGKS